MSTGRDSRPHEDLRQLAPEDGSEQDGRLGHDRAQRDGAHVSFRVPARMARRGGRPGVFTPRPRPAQQAVPWPFLTALRDGPSNTPKSSPPAKNSSERETKATSTAPVCLDSLRPSGLDTSAMRDMRGPYPHRGSRTTADDSPATNKTLRPKQGEPHGVNQNHQNRFRRPWSPDTATPRTAPAPSRPGSGEAPTSNLAKIDQSTLLPDLRAHVPIWQPTQGNERGWLRQGLACRRCLWRMGCPLWAAQPFDGCRNQVNRGPEFACQVCKIRKGGCHLPPAAVHNAAWALQRAWESQGANREAAISSAWKVYSLELEACEKKEGNERKALEAAATAARAPVPAPAHRPAYRAANVFQRTPRPRAPPLAWAREPVNVSQRPASIVTPFSTPVRRPSEPARQPASAPAKPPARQQPVADMGIVPTMGVDDTEKRMAGFAEGLRVGMSYHGPMPDGDFDAFARRLYMQGKDMPDSHKTTVKRKRSDDEENDGILDSTAVWGTNT